MFSLSEGNLICWAVLRLQPVASHAEWIMAELCLQKQMKVFSNEAFRNPHIDNLFKNDQKEKTSRPNQHAAKSSTSDELQRARPAWIPFFSAPFLKIAHIQVHWRREALVALLFAISGRSE